LVIRVGPAGWSYPDWEGRVYPAVKPTGFDALSFLTRFFDCVEVNSTFYAMPHPQHAERWVHVTRAHAAFRFVVKLHRSFTHEPEPTSDAWTAAAHAFNVGIEPLQRTKRLSSVLVQFPISFLYGKAEVRRLGRLRALFPHVPLVLEVRHQSWFSLPALDTIRGLSYSLAHTDQPAAWNHPPDWHASTGPIGYLRLHGRNDATWFRKDAGRDEKYDYLYSRDELAGLVAKVHRLAAEHGEVTVVTNNHFAGQAVANAIELLALIRGEPVLAPTDLVEAYPRLKSIVRADGQQKLF
jgi:uncharacterized protein YecE (DUF72 family)